jgi:hypothetical protein
VTLKVLRPGDNWDNLASRVEEILQWNYEEERLD